MQLIGYLDSPYVRRVAICARLLGVPFEHRELSIFRDYEAFRGINPLVKVPTWICDDGVVLVESSLIIDYLETLSENGVRLVPASGPACRHVLRCTGEALVAMEKGVQLVYEIHNRPADRQHAPWTQRVRQQLAEALVLMNANARQAAGAWMSGGQMGLADVTTAVAWRFLVIKGFEGVEPSDYPALADFSLRAEEQPEFRAFQPAG